jgi:CheY-like chemotaxis protein
VKSVVGRGSVFFALLPKHAPQRANVTLPLMPAERNAHREGAAVVLVVEDDLRDRALLIQTLSGAGYAVEAVATGQEAIERCHAHQYAAITLDLLLADTTGLDVLHRIRTDGKNRETPIVVVSVIAERGVVGAFPVHDYLQKPVNGQELLGSLKRVAAPTSRSATILVVDDDPSALKLMSTALRQCGYGVECLHDPEQALERARSLRPDVVILDLLMPGMDGFEFLLRFRGAEQFQHTPVIVWTMKDLSAHDHAELHRLAQGVIAKGTVSPIVEQLEGLLASKEEQGSRYERASQE